ncbi:MAG: N-acetyltransferase [Pseudomonadota bacterium]
MTSAAASDPDLTLDAYGPDTFNTSFLDVTDTVYKNVPEYCAPLRFDIASLLKSSSPYLEHAKTQYFVAKRAGVPVGRISAQVDSLVQDTMGKGTGQFGYFECEDNTNTARLLLNAAERWLKSQGMRRALGPFNPSINEEVGLLTEGFDTPNAVLMPHGRPYYRGLVEHHGYRQVKELYAYDYNISKGINPKFDRMVEWADANKDIEFRFLDMSKFEDEVTLALDIFNKSWTKNWGFTPMTASEAQRFRKSLKMIMQPELGAFAYYRGERVAFMFVLPDINVLTADFNGRLLPFNWLKLLIRLRRRNFPRLRTALLGTLPHLQNTRIGGILGISLIAKIRARVGTFNSTHSELSWILDDNQGINNMLVSVGAHIYKRYGMFEKSLD